MNDSVFQQQYSSAAGPRSGDVFPLNGCVLGCVLGRESYATAMRFGSGVWSGKCFSNYDYRAQHADVINLLSPLPPGVSVRVERPSASSRLPRVSVEAVAARPR